jgi:hypothetical protein
VPSYRPPKIASSEITPRSVYLKRREFLTAAAGTGIAIAAGKSALADTLNATKSNYTVNEKLTPIKDVTTYNNFYEFGLDKADPAKLSGNFKPRPWTVKVDGMVGKPGTFDIDALIKEFPPEERVYRMRCVEAWSMVIPWDGFPLSALLDKVEPLGSARIANGAALNQGLIGLPSCSSLFRAMPSRLCRPLRKTAGIIFSSSQGEVDQPAPKAIVKPAIQTTARAGVVTNPSQRKTASPNRRASLSSDAAMAILNASAIASMPPIRMTTAKT